MRSASSSLFTSKTPCESHQLRSAAYTFVPWHLRDPFASELLYANMCLNSSEIALSILIIIRVALVRPVACGTSGPCHNVSEKMLHVKCLANLGLHA